MNFDLTTIISSVLLEFNFNDCKLRSGDFTFKTYEVRLSRRRGSRHELNDLVSNTNKLSITPVDREVLELYF